jgi:hypothetical protein
MARYLPIAEHGMIGDLHTVALVGTDGTIDWYCCPRFDSPSVFAAILDADRGGSFRFSPDCGGWNCLTPMCSSRASSCLTESPRCKTSCRRTPMDKVVVTASSAEF